MNIIEAIKLLIENKSLTQRQAYNICLEIMNGNATPAQIGSFLTALMMKGETADEITGFVRAMRKKMIRINCDLEALVDTCGTGGDTSGTFNISTTAAFIAAGAGCHVAKHGNRSNSSHCGSADLMQEIGIKIDLPKECVEECLKAHNIAFLYAPLFHPAMKSVSGPRKEMGIRTIFNLLGPIANPAGVQKQIIGVCKKEFLPKIAEVLKNLGAKHCLVMQGGDGIDEITTTTITYVQEIKDSRITCYTISPEEFGIKICSIEELRVKATEENKRAVIDILNCVPGPKTDIAIMNAGAAIYVAGKADSIAQGIERARESLYSKSALRKFEALKRYTNEFSEDHNKA